MLWLRLKQFLRNRCWHKREVHQLTLQGWDDKAHYIAIAWKQCGRCGKSKLIHILE